MSAHSMLNPFVTSRLQTVIVAARPQFTDASKEHYKAFVDLYGQDTVEVDHPSAKIQEHKFLCSANLCFTNRRRCVSLWNVSAVANEDEFMLRLSLLVQTRTNFIWLLRHSCTPAATSVFPERHPVATVFVVRQDISCSDPVEKQYYSCKKFDLNCCRCGNTEPDTPVNEQMKKQYKVVHPVCRVCVENGEKFILTKISFKQDWTGSSAGFACHLCLTKHTRLLKKYLFLFVVNI